MAIDYESRCTNSFQIKLMEFMQREILFNPRISSPYSGFENVLIPELDYLVSCKLLGSYSNVREDGGVCTVYWNVEYPHLNPKHYYIGGDAELLKRFFQDYEKAIQHNKDAEISLEKSEQKYKQVISEYGGIPIDYVDSLLNNNTSCSKSPSDHHIYVWTRGPEYRIKDNGNRICVCCGEDDFDI